jgi:hypothetical protein
MGRGDRVRTAASFMLVAKEARLTADWPKR